MQLLRPLQDLRRLLKFSCAYFHIRNPPNMPWFCWRLHSDRWHTAASLGLRWAALILLIQSCWLAVSKQCLQDKNQFQDKKKIKNISQGFITFKCHFHGMTPCPSVWVSTDIHLCILSELVLQNQSIPWAMTDLFPSFIIEMDIQNYTICDKIIFCKYSNNTCCKFADPSRLSQAHPLPQWCSRWFSFFHYWVASQW